MNSRVGAMISYNHVAGRQVLVPFADKGIF
jgi:hypothetical protein